MSNLPELSRGEMLRLIGELNNMLADADRQEKKDVKQKFYGSQKDPVVRRLARMMLFRMRDMENLSYQEIADAVGGGISRERIHQLYKQLVGENETAEAQ